MLALHHHKYHDSPIGAVLLHLNKQKKMKSASKNSEAEKNVRPCKVEVTDYPDQNSIAACKRLVHAVQQTCIIKR